MEKEKFDKAIELYKKMLDIEEVIKELNLSGVMLTFISQDVPLRGWIFDNIREMLNKHHKEIIDEVNEMYDKIKKEINEL